MKKRRWLAMLVAAIMVCTMQPTVAMAEESADVQSASTACTLTEGCTLEDGHEGDCVLPSDESTGDESESVTNPCTVTEGCTLEDGHEGECKGLDAAIVPMAVLAEAEAVQKIKATVNDAEKTYSVGEAADEEQNVYASDFDALKAAIGEADNGTTVYLDSDLTLNENGITINKDLSIDLQQHTITAEDTVSINSQIFTVTGDVKLSKGTLVAKSGKVVSAGSTASGVCKLAIDDMKIQSKSAEAIIFKDNMEEVTIKNSNFSLLEGATAYYVINSTSEDTVNYVVENSIFDASAATRDHVCPVQINAVNAAITGCTFKSVGTNAVKRNGTTLYIYGSGTATVSDSTFISETASGMNSEALNIFFRSNGTINLDNNIFGSKLTLGNNDTYTVNINGSKFNTSEPIKVNAKIPTLNIKKAYFKDESIKNTTLLDATHPIMSNTELNKEEYPFVVALREDAADAICYVPSTDTFYKTIEEAKTAAAGSEIQLLQDIELDDFSVNINAKGYTVTTTKDIASQLSGIKGLSNAKLVGKDGTISNAFIENGKIVSGEPSEELAEFAYKNLHADSLIDSDTGEIKSADAFAVKIGNYGYKFMANAITVATKDDANEQKQETITLLKDIKDSVDVYYMKSSFILDLNGFTLGGESVNNSVMIAASGEFTPNDCDIIITDSSEGKTGKIVAKNYGVVTNGSLTGINLKLDGITVESASIGVYFPSNESELTIRDSTIKGNTGLAIKGGTVNLIDTEIYANGEKNVPEEGVSSGVNDTGDAIYIEGNYDHDINLNIQSGKYYSENGSALQELFVKDADAVAGEIEGGSFSSNPDEKYLSDDVKTIVKLSESDTPFVIGKAAEEVLENLTLGEEVELIKTDSVLTLPDGVIVKNETGQDITINGIVIEAGDTQTVHTHNAVKTDAKDATCTQNGNSAYWYCEGCDKYFSDESCTTETTLEETVIPAKGHGETEIKNAKDATCTAEGYTGDKVCKDCGEVVELGEVTAKTAHTYKDGKCTVCGAADPNDVPAPPSDKPTPPTDKPTPPSDKPTPPTDKPTPPSNRPKPTPIPSEKPTPVVKQTNMVKTGDNSNLVLWGVILLAAGAGITGVVLYGRKKSEKR